MKQIKLWDWRICEDLSILHCSICHKYTHIERHFRMLLHNNWDCFKASSNSEMKGQTHRAYWIVNMCFEYLCCALCSTCPVWAQHVHVCVSPWTVPLQAPLSMEFSKQEYWNGLHALLQGYLPDPMIKPASLASLALAGGVFTTVSPEKPFEYLLSCSSALEILLRLYLLSKSTS